MEFAIAFPLQLLVMLSIMQLALIYVGQQVVTYSAYKAARAAVVAESPRDAQTRAHRAAALICTPITGTTVRGASINPSELRTGVIELPGWGELPKSAVSNRLKTIVSSLEQLDANEVEATVTHYFELSLPVVGFLFGNVVGGSPADIEYGIGAGGNQPGSREADHESRYGIWQIRAPHMRLRSTARAARPGRRE